MPLSEHEQKILAELEESLAIQDPGFVKSVRETNVYAYALRQVRWAVLTFLVGLATLLVFFTSILAIGFVGVSMMFVSAVVIERNMRRIGRASWRDISRPRSSDDAPRMNGSVQEMRDWIEKRRKSR